MFGRLKSLPLTIVLTILIWMYAEAEFSTTQEGVPVRIQFQSSDPAHFSVRAVDEDGNTFRTMDITLTLQGGKDQIERLVQQSRARYGSGDVLAPIPIVRDPPAAGTIVLLAPVLNELPFFRDRGVIVAACRPDRVHLQAQGIETYTPPAPIRINLSGPPEVLSPYHFEISPRTVTVKASGPPETIAKLRTAMAIGTGAPPSDIIRAYVDITPDDKPSDKPITRKIRYALPDGVTLESKIDTVEVRTFIPPSPAPATLP